MFLNKNEDILDWSRSSRLKPFFIEDDDGDDDSGNGGCGDGGNSGGGDNGSVVRYLLKGNGIQPK